MRKFVLIAGAALVIVVVGVVIGMLATSGTEMTYTSINSVATGTVANVTTGTTPSPALPGSKNPTPPSNPPAASLPAVELVSTNLAALTNDWSDHLDEILGADKPEKDKASQLLAMFPHLPKDGQEEVAQHLTNLVDDEDYASLGKFLTNSVLAEDVLDVLFTDLFNRPNGLKLPLLVDIARDPKHPKAEEAKDLLELYLEEDYGTDWAVWRSKAEQWLKDNPE